VPIREVVSQISPPIRILLLCAVAFLGAWMLFLRPKNDTAAEPPAPAPNVQTGEPAVSQPGKVAEAAQDAVNAANGQLAAQESVDGVDAGEVAAGAGTGTAKGADAAKAGAAAAIPADLKGVPAPVAKAIRRHKVLVLLFWNDKSADDRAVKRALKDVDRWDGRVYVQAAPIKSISKYGRITRGADVEQSPTVVVVDSQLRADTVVGYVDATTIDQMVVDAFRNSTGLFTDTYLRKINQVCMRYSNKLWAIPDPDSRHEVSTFVTTAHHKWTGFERDFKAVPAPKKWRSLKRATVRDNAAAADVIAELAAYLGTNPSISRIVTGINRYQPRLNEIGRGYNRRMDNEHVLSCGSDS
jgi:hypothetical protein